MGNVFTMDWLSFASLVAASIHITEEFVLPGGFARWYRRYRLDASRITPRFLVLINAALILACCNVALLGRMPIGIGYWLVTSALLCSNGCWHVWASYKSRSYSPGVVTGVALYLPLAVYGYGYFLRSGAVSIATAAVTLIIGGSYPLWRLSTITATDRAHNSDRLGALIGRSWRQYGVSCFARSRSRVCSFGE